MLNKKGLGKGPTVFVVLGIIVAAIVILMATNVVKVNVGGTSLAVQPVTTTSSTGQNQQVQSSGTGVSTYQPTATYSAIDSFSTTPITGTSYYKADGQKAGTTALTNVNPGVQYTYWVDNGTGGAFVKPVVFTASQGVNNIVAPAWQNSSATITAYDNNAGTAITAASHNVTLSANGQANIDLKYQGVAKKSDAPFGGVMVVEYNSTIASLAVSSPYIMASNPYHLTYTVANTADTYQEYAFSSGLDDGSGNLNHITLQFTNGATAQPAGGAWYVKFYPANYYVTNSGNIVLDTQEYENGVTTRTTTVGPETFTGYWA